MGQPIIVTGMVLFAAPIGEYDKRVVLLTRERGKITAFAKGARRPKSSLLASTNPFAFGQYECYEGRNSYSIYKADIQNYFLGLVNDLNAAYYGFYFLELTNYYTRENNDEVLMLKLLYQTFRALEKNTIDKELIRYIFELKATVVNGEYPQVFSCVQCKKEADNGFFSSRRSGYLCQSCFRDGDEVIRIQPSTLYTMQYIITSPIEKLYTFKVTDEVLGNLKRIMKQYYTYYLDKPMKSLSILESMI